MNLDEYVLKIANFDGLSAKEKVDRLSFFLIAHGSKKVVTCSELKKLYKDLKIKPYSRIPQYLSEESRKKGGKYIREDGGYILERSILSRLKGEIDRSPRRVQVDDQLKDLVTRISDTQEQGFLQETIDCLSVGANRAALVMMWILTMDHLQKYIFNDPDRLLDFNTAISKRAGNKIKSIKDYDDFSIIKESDVIEIAKSAGIISADVRKILDEKLGIRNSAGHPSSITVHETKVNEFIFDLTNNVLLKYL